ncbi:hsp90 co-chaperone Cdc37 [Phlebotomus argentipes]|uniref:hsp90 co-chaperone Cdc37 n=1 Tax=Phlebotomus argentipes TaxID=94469 RepID=UPI0028936E7C|nr:hsp90 co-chaperone Cdc37 [Phlebotomus argentipes]
MVDYSKWKNIEISDDEDDTHPNIDTPSLFRWRHRARVERMEEAQKEKEEFEAKKKETEQKLKELQTKVSQEPEASDAKKELEKLEKAKKELQEKEEEMVKKERQTPWNVDTISKPGFAKTVINTKPARPKDEELTEEEREQRMKDFVKENEKLLKKFGMLRKFDDSKQFLAQHHELVCENTANYLVIWCINLEMEEKKELMAHVAHQCICMQYILELSKQLDVDPRACVSMFFSRIQVADVEYKSQFEDEVESFKQRIRKRAAEKIAAAAAEAEEEERLARLGPGGLDPEEVINSLPEELQKCFESRDVKLLQDTIAKMNPEEAKYHMKRCIDSGLWVPDANKGDAEDEEEGEEIYQEASSELPKTTTSTDDVD